jgi:DNA-binding NtrC family response regulator
MPDEAQVLVVDDHPRMVALITRWLVRAGYHVTGVTTVQDALEVLATKPVAWVITDLIMPTGDGLDILAHARAHHPQARIIIMTAFGSEATRQRALACGAHAFLSKPFSGEALVTILTQELPSEPTRSSPGANQPGS